MLAQDSLGGTSDEPSDGANDETSADSVILRTCVVAVNRTAFDTWTES